jgi:phosphopantetheine adenylyltransferase
MVKEILALDKDISKYVDETIKLKLEQKRGE